MGLPRHRSRGGKRSRRMKNRAKASVPAEVGAGLLFTAQQLLLPMIAGIVHSRRELFSWVQQVGISALNQRAQRAVRDGRGGNGRTQRHASHRTLSLSLGYGADRAAV